LANVLRNAAELEARLRHIEVQTGQTLADTVADVDFLRSFVEADSLAFGPRAENETQAVTTERQRRHVELIVINVLAAGAEQVRSGPLPARNLASLDQIVDERPQGAGDPGSADQAWQAALGALAFKNPVSGELTEGKSNVPEVQVSDIKDAWNDLVDAPRVRAAWRRALAERDPVDNRQPAFSDASRARLWREVEATKVGYLSRD
jgi:hypothetical protein